MQKAMIASLIFLALALQVSTADAHLFLASATGQLTVKLLTNPKVTSAAGEMECKGAHLTEGEVNTTKSLVLTSTVEFEKCTIYGFPATLTLIKVQSTAEGTVSLLKTVEATLNIAKCGVLFPSAKNQGLSSVKYTNTNKQIEKVATVSNLAFQGSGGFCGTAKETGKFTGNAVVGLMGGTIDWQ